MKCQPKVRGGGARLDRGAQPRELSGGDGGTENRPVRHEEGGPVDYGEGARPVGKVSARDLMWQGPLCIYGSTRGYCG